MNKAVIVSAARTAVGKAHKGSLKDTRPEEMGAALIKGLLQRTPALEPGEIDDVIIGCAFPESEQGLNLGRVLAAKAGLPHTVPGMTVNRFCASGLEAIAMGCERIICGMADVIIASGVESMSLVPMGGFAFNPDPTLIEQRPWVYEAMGISAENVAQKYGITREQQDNYALKSHIRALNAIRNGSFTEQIIPVKVAKQSKNSSGGYEIYEEEFSLDEGPLDHISLEMLSRMRPVFKREGSVTAGNSSQTSDGAAAVLCMSEKKAHELGLVPMLTYKSYAVSGVDPRLMGIGPIAAIPKALQLAALRLCDIGLIELNEAFASQVVYCINHLGLNTDITNVNGGAIALGHPLGCTGAKLTVQLAHEMKNRDLKYGLVSMCIGFGMGAAGVFEKYI